jgi:hypothetical protein
MSFKWDEVHFCVCLHVCGDSLIFDVCMFMEMDVVVFCCALTRFVELV